MSKTVLIIEDDADTAFMLEVIIKQMGYQVNHMPVILSVSTIKSLNPDLILLDHWMGDQLGGKLCSEIKSDPDANHIPVIMVSAVMDIGKIANENGADDCIEKPFDIDILSALIKEFVAG